MSDIRIVKSREIAFDEHGARVFTDETYIKLLTSFKRGALRALKGAPLAVFLCIALHEAEDNPGVGHRVIESETGYSHPAVGEAIKFLLDAEHHFIDDCGKECDGTKRYRPAAYAWFGRERDLSPPGAPPNQLSLLPDLERPTSLRQPYELASSSPPNDKGPQPASSIRPDPHQKSLLGGAKVLPPGDDDDVLKSPNSLERINSERTSSSSFPARVQKTEGGAKLFEAGIRGKNLVELADRVPADVAAAWAEWAPRAKASGSYPNPGGYAATALANDPAAVPPELPASRGRRNDWVYPEYVHMVHGSREHAEYCRQHPGEFDCHCGDLLDLPGADQDLR